MDIDVESAADIEVLDYTLKFKNTLTATDQLEDVRVSVDGDEFDLPMSLFDDDGNWTVNAADTDWVVNTLNINLADKYLNAFTVDAWKKANVKAGTTKKAATAGDYQITLDINKIKSIDTKNTITWTPLDPLDTEDSHLTEVADAWIFVITQKSTDGNTIKIWEAKDVLSFTAKAKSEDLKVKTLTFRIPATALTTTQLKDIVDYVVVDWKKVLVKDMEAKMVCYNGSDIANWSYVDDENTTCSAAAIAAWFGTIYPAGGTWLEWEITLNKTIKEWETVTYTVSLKTAGDITVGLLWEKINVVLPVNGLYAKGATSDWDVYNTTEAEWTTYQLVTVKPEIELSQDGKFITVTFNNESDYTVWLMNASIEVLSERTGWDILLPTITKWNVRKNTKNGTILATETNPDVDWDWKTITTTWSNLPWEFTLAFAAINDWQIAEWESMTFVIEMNTTVNIYSTDYTVSAKSFSYKYRDEDINDWWTQIDEDL